MSFYSSLTGKIYKRKEKRKLKNLPAEYVGRFYRNLANNVNNFLGSDFYEQIASGYGMLSADIQNNILATGDFAKGMQTDINHYVTNDKINSASFRQKLDSISKNILRRQNLLELVLKDISMFDAENPIVVSLLKELDVGKMDIASELIKKAPRPPGVEFAVRKRLEKLKNRPGPKDGDDIFNLLPPPSPPRPSSLGPQPP